MTASGCGATVKEYGHLLEQDPAYRDKAARISSITRDLCEVITPDMVAARAPGGKVAFQSPCTLQHGQQLRGGVETHLNALGFNVRVTAGESHLCCGSAGTYSVLQSELAYQLRDRKLGHLAALEAQTIVSANIGCIQHLQTGTETPVKHWIEVLDAALA